MLVEFTVLCIQSRNYNAVERTLGVKVYSSEYHLEKWIQNFKYAKEI